MSFVRKDADPNPIVDTVFAVAMRAKQEETGAAAHAKRIRKMRILFIAGQYPLFLEHRYMCDGSEYILLIKSLIKTDR